MRKMLSRFRRSAGRIVPSRVSRFFRPSIDLLEDRVLMTLGVLPNQTLPTSQQPLDVQLGQINNDSFLDMAVLGADGKVTVALNDGNGSWSAVQTIDVGLGAANGMALTRWDGDPYLDLLIQGPNGISVLTGDGAGGFDLTQTISPTAAGTLAPSGGGHVQMTATLLNADGYTDLVTVAPGTNEVLVFLGNSNGTLGAPTHYAAGVTQPVAVAVGDFIGNAAPDLAVGGQDGSVAFLQGNGNGTFAARSDLTATGLGSVTGLAVGAFSGADDQLAVSTTNGVFVLTNNHAEAVATPLTNGQFTTGLGGWSTTGPVSAQSGVAQLQENTNGLLTTLKQTFVVPESAQTISFDLVSLGLEVPGSGNISDAFEASLLDAQGNSLVTTFDPQATSFFNANPDGVFSLATGVTFVGSRVTLDISSLAPGTQATLYLDLIGNPSGTGSTATIDNVQVTAAPVSEAFTTIALAGPFGSVTDIATGDVDGDGHADLVAMDAGLGKLLVYNGNGAGQFTRSEFTVSGFGSGASAVATGPLVSDHDDVALTLFGSNIVLSPLGLVVPDTTAPQVALLDPVQGQILQTSVTQVRIQFTEAMLETGPSGSHSVTNPAGYLLYSSGLNGLFENGSGDDVVVSIASVSYNPLTFTATLTLAAGTSLAAGSYRLVVKGADPTSSLQDLAGNRLGNGTDAQFFFTVGEGCPIYERDAQGNPIVLEVNQNVTVDFNTVVIQNGVVVQGPTYIGDPDLQPYLSYDVSGPTADTWKAIFNLGGKSLLVKNGATITVRNVPPTSNNQRAPGLDILTTGDVTVEQGGTITLTPLNKPGGTIRVLASGNVLINGVISNVLSGTNGTPGGIVIAAHCGTITTGAMSRIETIGQDHSGGDIKLLAGGDIDLHGLVDASAKGVSVPTITIVSFAGAVSIDGTTQQGIEAGTQRPITTGVTVRSRRDPLAGTILIQAQDDITVVGNRIIDKLHPNLGAVAVSPKSTNGQGGTGLIKAVSLGGKIIATDRAFDFENRFNANNAITLQAQGNIELSVTSVKNDGASTNAKAVVSTRGGTAGKGGTNTLRSYAGGIIIGTNAQVLADFTGTPGTNGTNLLISATGITNLGLVNPADLVTSDNSGVTTPPAPPVLFDSFEDLGVEFDESSVVNHPPFTIGTTVTNSIGVAGEVDVWTFTGTAGQRIFLDAQNGSSTAFRWSLVDPNGVALFGDVFADRDTFTLATSGTYTLTVEGRSGQTGAYQFKVWDVPATTVTSITVGQVVGSSIAVPGAQAAYTFTGAAGDHLFFDVQNSNGGALSFTILRPDSTVLLNASTQNQGNGITLPSSGTYTVVVGHGAALDATGPFQFQLFAIPADVPQTIALNTVVNGALTVPGQAQSFTFAANLGQQLLFDVLSTNPSVLLTLRDSATNVLFAGQTGDQLLSSIPSAGIYTLTIAATSNQAGSFSFQVVDQTTPTATTPTVPLAVSTMLPTPVVGERTVGPVDFAHLTTITGLAAVNFTGTTFNRDTQTLHVDVSLTNTSLVGLGEQIVLAFDRFTPPAVQVDNPDLLHPDDGRPLIVFGPEFGANGLLPGETSQTVALRLSNPSEARFGVITTLLAPGNEVPVFTSTPVTQVDPETPYTYQATATDDNGDSLTFALLAGPDGMTVDAQTGVVTWTPTPAQVGSWSIVLQVSDGRGGSATQSYDLQVGAVGSSNRDPIIVSTPAPPAVLAGQTFLYAVEALDPDNDTLSFSLTDSPVGMTIDSQSGLVSWTSSLVDVGTHVVTIEVSDGLGGLATQSFDLEVSDADPGTISGIKFNDRNGNGVRDQGVIVYDPAAQFSATSNPAGVWTYGYETVLGQESTFGLSHILAGPPGLVAPGVDAWGGNATPEGQPSVSHNHTSQTVSAGTVFWGPDELTLHPGPNGEYAILRFTAPTAGLYRVAASFAPRDTNPNFVDVHILHNGASFFDADVSTVSVTAPTADRLLAAGDTIDFAVGVGQDGQFNFGTTLLEATVTNVPITFTDDFETGPSALWSNDRGNWFGAGGIYSAASPTNQPPTYSALPYDLQDFILEVDVNNLQDGGIWLRSQEPGVGVLLITGGHLGTGTGLYWHIITDPQSSGGPSYNPVNGLFTPGADNVHLRVVVVRDTYSVFVNGSTTAATTLTTDAFSHGKVGLYDFSNQTFDNFQVVGTSPEEPTLADWTIYLDQNHNGQRDANETFTTTDANGEYLFTNLAPGTYRVAEEQQAGWIATTPPGGSALVTIGPETICTDDCLPPPAGMVAWWAGDNNARDIAGSADGTLLHGTDFGPGLVAPAFHFDGIDDMVDIGNPAAVQLSAGTFTVSTWVNFDALSHPPGINPGGPPGDMMMINKMVPGGPNEDGWFLIKQDDNHFWFSFGAPGNGAQPHVPTTVRSTTVATTGAWYLVAGVLDATTFSVYVNGVLEASKARPAFVDTQTANLTLGAHPGYGRVNGFMDEVQLYNRALTAAEIQAIFEAGSAGLCKPGSACLDFGNMQGAPGANQDPIFTSAPVTSATVGELYSYTATAADGNGDLLTYSLVTRPDGMVIDSSTGRIYWVPEEIQAGTQSVVVKVVDGNGGIALQSFDILTDTNYAPIFVSEPGSPSVLVGQTFTYAAQALDPDGDTLEYSLDTAPQGMTIDPDTGLVTWSASSLDQYANEVLEFSSQNDTTTYAAERALGAPDRTVYGDIPGSAWTALTMNGTQEFLTLGFATPVHATGLTIREVSGNGFVTQVDLLDTDGVYHTVFTGPDYTVAGAIGHLDLSFAPTPYLVRGVKIYVNTDHNTSTWEEIDSVQLHADPVGFLKQWGNQVIDVSSEWSATEFAAAQALGSPNVPGPNGRPEAWAPANINGTTESITVGFATPVYATGVLVREAVNNGFVTGVDLLDTDGVYHTIPIGNDPTSGMSPQDFVITFERTSYLVQGVRVHVDGNHASNSEEIDAIALLSDQSAPVTVRVEDAHGGVDTQSFDLTFSAAGGGNISGKKFHDVDGNGATEGPNLLVNGDFSAGAADFVTDYIFTTGFVSEGFYTVDTNPQLHHGDATPIGDHTTGAGNMMILNGAFPFNPPWRVWQQTVAVLPDSTYDLSAWAASWTGGFPAKLRFTINGDFVGQFNLTGSPEWAPFNTTWNSGSNTTATIAIVNDEFFFLGNDFALDDLAFRRVEPGLADWVIYLDQNANGRRDTGERFTTTDASGNYAFTGLSAGTYIVAEEPQFGWVQTYPTIRTHTLTVAAGQTLEDINFGNRLAAEAGPNDDPEFSSTPPSAATTAALLRYQATATDADGDALHFDVVDGPDGLVIDQTSGVMVWIPANHQVGTHDVTLRVLDGRGGAALQNFEITVTGGVVLVGGLSITSAPVLLGTAGQAYTYTVTAEDDNGQTPTFTLMDGPSGMTIDGHTGIITWTPATGDTGPHVVLIQATTPAGATAYQSYLLTVRAANVAPTIFGTPLTSVSAGTTYLYTVQAFDPMDAISFALAAGPAGMTVDPRTGLVYWQPALADLGAHAINIRVSDERGAFTDHPYTLTVSADTEAPSVAVFETINVTTPGTEVGFQVAATDNIGVVSRTLTINGVPQTLDSIGIVYYTPTAPGIYTIVGTATDAAGNVDTADRTLRVLDPNDVTEPTVIITSPTWGDTVTYLTPIRGTVTDPNLEFYRVEYSRLGTDEWHFIEEHTTAVVNDTLAIFDPTLLPNDAYWIRVTAQDVSGNIYSLQTQVNVSQNAKIGNFHLEYTDLSVPLAGIPIQVTRVYDTLQADQMGDFGFGWTMSLANANIRETVPQDPNGFFATGAAFRAGTKVYLTTPDGNRVGFTFDPIRQDFDELTGLPFPFGPVWKPHFKADPGVFETLEVADISLTQRGDGTFGFYLFGIGFNPDDFTLTTKDGTRYQYNQSAGLQTVTDTNSNVLTFTRDGIFSSTGQSIDFVRDAAGRITEIVDPAGNSILYNYSDAGDLIGVTNQVNATSTYEYSSSFAHFLTAAIDALGNRAIGAFYDENGRLSGVSDGLNNTSTVTYDLTHFTEHVHDPLGNTTTLVYDDRGNVVSETNDLDETILHVYDDANNEIETTDARGHTTTRTFDERGNVLKMTDALQGLWTYTYNQFNQVLTFTDANNHTITNVYDPRGNLIEVIDAAGNSSFRTYDEQGRLLTITPFCGCASAATTYEYGDGPNPIKVINADGTFRTFEYNEYGQAVRVVDENSHETLVSYDEIGRPEWTRDALLHTTYFGFNAADQLVSVLDPLNNLTQYVYNAAGQRIQEIDPQGAVTQYFFDAAGNYTRTIDRNGNVREFVYDEANRRIREDWITGTTTVRQIHYGYDENGNLISVSDPDSSYAFTYDELNKVTSVDNFGTPGAPHVILFYGYDSVGNVTFVEDNAGVRVDKTYDARNLLTRLLWSGGGIDPARVDISYNERGLVTEVERFSDLAGTQLVNREVRDYDDRNQLTDQQYRNALDQTFIDYDYDYDPVGQLTREVYNGDTADFDYDPTGQLVEALRSNGPDESFSWDANGNPNGPGYLIGPGNQLLSDGTYNYEYDDNGSLIRKTEIATGNYWEYTWDHRGRMVEAVEKTAGGIVLNEVKHTYDVFDRRIATETNGNKLVMVYNGAMTWADYDSDGTTLARHLTGNRIDEWLARWRPGEGTSWYLTDRLGSTRDIVNGAGSLISHIDYASFGAPQLQHNTNNHGRILFSGREYDGITGLYAYRTRWFDAESMRFVSEDLIGFRSGDHNLFRYVFNSPINASDPWGLAPGVDYVKLVRERAGRLLERSRVLAQRLRGFHRLSQDPARAGDVLRIERLTGRTLTQLERTNEQIAEIIRILTGVGLN